MMDSVENAGIYDFLKKGPAKLENTYKLGRNIFIWLKITIFQKCLESGKKGIDRSFRVHLVGIDGLENFCHRLKNDDHIRLQYK